MYNWSVDLEELKKSPKKAIIWKIEQSINFGLNGEKLNKELIKKYWKKLHIDPARKKFLKFLLWPAKS
jgi:hypothetical protein